MITFQQPSFLVLGALLAAWVWFYSRGSPLSRATRILSLVLLTLGLAQPRWRRIEIPVQLVILVDRSPSMPPDLIFKLREWLSPSALKLRPEDEVTLIGFSSVGHTEMKQLGQWPGFREWRQVVPEDRTDIGAALDMAASLLDGKPGARVLLISDGLDQGGRVATAISRLAAMNIPVHTRWLGRSDTRDVAVQELLGPTRIRTGQPFMLSATVWSSESLNVHFRLTRGGTLLSEGDRLLQRGVNAWRFRDALAQAQLQEYRLEVKADHDAFPENNTGLALVRAMREKNALIWTQQGQENALSADLKSLGFDTEVRSAGQPPQSAAELSGARLVVLENVAATDLGLAGLEAFRLYVERLGGALLVTGGQSSYGIGGYHRSPLAETLPISMEVRKEQRKAAVAICIVLDRSGSMAATAAPGVTKMQLADEGTVAALQMLTANDWVSVIAVDSEPHLMVPLQILTDVTEVSSKVRKIVSMGGGIYVRTGLQAAMKELENAPPKTRHILLFADAGDSEEQEGVPALIEQCKAKGITLSVIGLGTPADSDARFLQGMAAQAGGRMEFTNDPHSLPQVFAKETITLLRSTFIQEPVDLGLGPDISRLGPSLSRQWPRPGGYNVTYLRPGAGLGIRAQDDQQSPMLAFWQRGRGRAAACMWPWEGEYSGGWASWPGRGDLLGQVTTWLTTTHESTLAQMRWDYSGIRPVLRLTLAQNSDFLAPEPGRLTLIGPEGETQPDILFHQGDDGDWIASPNLIRPGHYIATFDLDEKTHVVSPPCSVAYVPEFDFSNSRSREDGQALLTRIQTSTAGTAPVRFAELLEKRPRYLETQAHVGFWWIAAMLIYLLEIAAERFGWFQILESKIARTRKSAQQKAPISSATSPMAPLPPSHSLVETQHSASLPTPPASAAETPERGKPVPSALSEAKRRAKKHF